MASIDSNSAQAPLDDYDGVSPRVNSNLLRQYMGFFVILPCQVVQVSVSPPYHTFKLKDSFRIKFLPYVLWRLMAS
jgi:hypothetical protein